MRTMSDFLADGFPVLASRLPRLQLADLPTPVEQKTLHIGSIAYDIAIKRDDVTGKLYGGNKVRKLEYLFAEAQQRQSNCIATFGTVASNHALATSLYAREIGYPCICFLSHQARTPSAARALNMHLQIGTQIVRYNWTSEDREALVRDALSSYRAFLIPPGGSSPLGATGFVNAGLELAAQVQTGETVLPSRIYVANGTMGTAVGLALGLALAGLETEVHAVQVTEDMVSSPDAMQELLRQTALNLRKADKSIPADLADRARYQFRTGFLGDGYAKTNDATETAIAVARDELGIELEATYTGKAMAALLGDLHAQSVSGPVLFWNTYNSRPLAAGTTQPENVDGLPEEFLRYFD
jgi:D-cysteine desulfhydrase